jgi:hypothetical protein
LERSHLLGNFIAVRAIGFFRSLGVERSRKFECLVALGLMDCDELRAEMLNTPAGWECSQFTEHLTTGVPKRRADGCETCVDGLPLVIAMHQARVFHFTVPDWIRFRRFPHRFFPGASR